MLKVVKEPKDLWDVQAENCCLCKVPTRFWYKSQDVALCETCAKQAKKKDIPTKRQWCDANKLPKQENYWD